MMMNVDTVGFFRPGGLRHGAPRLARPTAAIAAAPVMKLRRFSAPPCSENVSHRNTRIPGTTSGV